MSLKHYLNKPPYYWLRKNETLASYFIRILRTVIKMYPSARLYGLRYYVDHRYRMTCLHRRTKDRQNATRRKKQGRYFRKNRWKIKAQLIERDGRICCHCRQPFEWQELTLDHIIRLADGGTSILENLQLLCVPCHEAKTKQENANTH